MKTEKSFEKKYRTKRRLNRAFILLLYFLFLIFVSLIFLGLTGCRKDSFDFGKLASEQSGAEWCIPLAHGELFVSDIVSDSLNLSNDETGLVSFVFQGETSSPPVLETLNVEDIHDSFDFMIELPEFVPPGDTVYIPFAHNFQIELLSGQRINSISFHSCNLHLDFSSDINRDAMVVLTIPDALKNNQPYRDTLFYQYSSSNTLSLDINLSGYEVHLVHQGDNFNLMRISAEVYAISNNEPDNSPYTFYFDLQMTGIVIKKVTGYVGQFEFPIYTDTLDLDLFQKQINGSLHFADPTVHVIAKNSTVAPARITFNSVKALYNKAQNDSILISGEGLPEDWDINTPASEYGTAVTGFVLNATNSNIKEVLDRIPDQIIFSVSGMVNPSGRITNNIIDDSSRISLFTELKLPLYGSADNLILEDTFDINFENIDNFNSVEFKTTFENSFPVDLGIQVYFLNREYNIIDSVFQQGNVITHADFNPETGKVIAPSMNVFTEKVSAGRMEELKYSGAKVIVKASLNTPGQDQVKIFTDNNLQFHLGVKIQK